MDGFTADLSGYTSPLPSKSASKSGVERLMNIARLLLLLFSIITSSHGLTKNIPCPTFENRTINCFPKNQDHVPAIAVLPAKKTGDGHLKSISDKAITFSHHPPRSALYCDLIGSIPEKINLTESKKHNALLQQISIEVAKMGGNYVVVRQPSDTNPSEVYVCP